MTTANNCETRCGPLNVLYLEEEATKRLSSKDFLEGLFVIVDHKELDLCEDPEGNRGKLEALGDIRDLIYQARIGLWQGIFTLSEDAKGQIPNILTGICFRPQEVNILSITSAAKGDSKIYAPEWALEQVREKMKNDKGYGGRLLSTVKEIAAIKKGEEESEEVFEESLRMTMGEVARDLASEARDRYRGLTNKELSHGKQPVDSNIVELSSRRRPKFKEERERLSELEPISLPQFLRGLRTIAEELKKPE